MKERIFLMSELKDYGILQQYCDEVNKIIRQEFGPVIAKKFAVDILGYRKCIRYTFGKLCKLRFFIGINDYAYYDSLNAYEKMQLHNTTVSYTGKVLSQLELKVEPRLTQEIIDATTQFCQNILEEHPFSQYLKTGKF